MSKQRTEALDRIAIFLHNKEVKDYFRDIPDTNTDKRQPRVAAKEYFLIKDDDSSTYQVRAMQIFQAYVSAANKEMDYYSVPIDSYHLVSSHLPQITLYFRPKKAVTDTSTKSKSRRPMEVSFRVRQEKLPKTDTELRAIAASIKRIFDTPPYKYTRGKNKLSYQDRELGYEFIIGFQTESEALKLMKDVMSILNDMSSLNESKIRRSEPVKSTYVASEQRVKIRGKYKQLPDRYDTVDFVFSHADYKHYPDKPVRIVWQGAVVV
jgi:hypothetical protein